MYKAISITKGFSKQPYCKTSSHASSRFKHQHFSHPHSHIVILFHSHSTLFFFKKAPVSPHNYKWYFGNFLVIVSLPHLFIRSVKTGHFSYLTFASIYISCLALQFPFSIEILNMFARVCCWQLKILLLSLFFSHRIPKLNRAPIVDFLFHNILLFLIESVNLRVVAIILHQKNLEK